MAHIDAYSLFFETSPQPLYIVSKQTMKFLAVNEAAVAKYGYSKEEFLQMDLRDIRSEEDVDQFENDFNSSKPGLSNRSIWPHKLRDGSRRLMEITARSIDWMGEEARFVMADDVTEKLMTVKALKASEDRLKATIIEAPYPVMIHAEGAEVIAVSRSWIEGTGYDLSELRELHEWTGHAFGDQADTIRAGVATVQTRQTLRHQDEFRIRCKDGSFRIWDIVTVAAGQLPDGRNVAISSGYDLTEREALAADLRLNSAALEAVANDVFITDQEGVANWLSSSHIQVRASRAEAYLQQSTLEETDPYIELWKQILNGQVWKGELVKCLAGGPQTTEEVSITPFRGSTGRIENFICIKQDITESRRTAELIDARLKLLENSRNLSVKDALTLALDEGCRLTHSTFGFYDFVEDNEETLSVQACSTHTQNQLCCALPFCSKGRLNQTGIWRECVNTRQPVVENNYQNLDLIETLPFGRTAITRKLIVPILKENKVVALMAVGNKPTDYGQNDVETIRYLADIAWEIADRRKSEDLLQLQSAALEAADNAIIITDKVGTIEWANPAFSRLTGYSLEEILGKTPKELVHTDLNDGEVYENMWSTIESNGVWSGDMVNRRKDGQLYIEEQTITPMIGRSNSIEHYIGIKEDVTHFRRSEALLEARLSFTELVKSEGAESILRAVVEHAQLLTFSPNGCFNIMGRTLIGLNSFEASPEIYCSLESADEQSCDSRSSLWKACLETGKAQIKNHPECEDLEDASFQRSITVPVMRNDDVVAMLAVQGASADYTGVDVETLGYLAEIAYETIRQHLSEKENSRQGALLEQLYDAVFAWKLDGRIVYWNKGAERLYGYTSQEAIGKSVHHLLRTEFSRYSSEHAIALALQDRWEGEIVTVSKDGQSHLVESRMTLTSDPDEQLVLEVNRDISATRAAEEQLLRLNADLEERVLSRTAELSIAKAEADKANSAKSEFLSRMSHELRTPLNSILGFSQILQLHYPEGEVKELSDPIIKAGRHLLGLINEILDISRIEAGGLTMDISPCQAISPIQDALDLIAPLASTLGITIEVPEEQLTAWIHADSRRLVQVILNVLSNAVKYNRTQGHIWLRWSQEDDYLVLRIQDSGTGISATDAPKLFQPFMRFGDSFIEGTGLGLPLSQRLIHLMNGDLYLESSSPSGSTFLIKVPLSQDYGVQPIEVRPPSDYGLQDLVSGRILYIEDDLGNIQLMDHLIALFPEISLLPAMQGSLGLELAKQHKPDLIILDAHLPDISGLEVLKELKRHEDTNEIPVVILSADATQVNRNDFAEAGAQDFITKPINVEDLMKLISNTLRGSV